MNFKLIVIEGIHLRRGCIAALCCRRTLPDAQIIGLAWNLSFSDRPSLTKIHYPTVETYYTGLRDLLTSTDRSLVIPCTQLGTVICNQFRDRHLVLAEATLTEINAFDKLSLKSSQEQLRQYFPKHCAASMNDLPLPLLAKPRIGHSSAAQHLIRTETDLQNLGDLAGYFVEEIIPSPMDEYSLTAVRSNNAISWMCLRREHQESGRTVKSSKVTDERILHTAEGISRALAFDSVYNVQFAMLEAGPIIYDLNPRFGHSELYRSCFGFNFISAFLNQDANSLSSAQSLREDEAFQILS